MLALAGAEPGVVLPEGAHERVVQNRRADLEEGLHCRPIPSHLPRLVHPLGHDLDRGLHERDRDRQAAPRPGSLWYQR